MATRCPECATPAVAGHRFCGRCGALVAPRADLLDPLADVAPLPDAADASASPAPVERRPLPGWLAEPGVPAPVVVDARRGPGAAEAAPGPVVAASPGLRGRLEARPGGVAAAAVLLLVVGLGRATADGEGGTVAALAGAPATGNAHLHDVVVPELGTGLVWQLDGSDADDALGPLPWAAPVVQADRIVTVVPGAVVVHDREDDSVHRVEVATSGLSAPVVLEDGSIVVVAGRDAWWLDDDGVLARTTTGDVADVTPVAVGDAVVLETTLGALRRVGLRADGSLEERRLRGVDVVDEDATPRFHLASHVLDGDVLWVGSRNRGSDDVILWRLAADTLAPLGRVDLPTTQVPTMAAVPDGVVVAHDDRVAAHRRDGTLAWERQPGRQAEVLGAHEDHVLVRHEAGRAVYAASRDGALVARATTALLDGPRSGVAAGEVLVADGERIQSLRVADATVARRLEGEPLSVGGQDGATIAYVTRGVTGALVLRLQPAVDRVQDARQARLVRPDAVDLPLPLDPACRVAGAGDRVAWHDGSSLREVRLEDASVRGRIDAASTRRSELAVDGDGRSHLVDPRGVTRRFPRGLREFEVLAIGDDPIGGVALDGDLVVAAGGTGRVAIVGSSDGYLRGMDGDGATRWLVRIQEAVASPPAAHEGTAVVRQVNGALSFVRDGLFVAQVPADARALDPPLLDARGIVFRDGVGVSAAFPQGELAWTAPDVSALPGLAGDGEVVVARGVDELVGLDRSTGTVRWRADVVDGSGRSTTPLSVPTLAGGVVLVAVHDGVVAHDARTGREVSRSRVAGTLAGPIVPTTIGVVACLSSGDLALLA